MCALRNKHFLYTQNHYYWCYARAYLYGLVYVFEKIHHVVAELERAFILRKASFQVYMMYVNTRNTKHLYKRSVCYICIRVTKDVIHHSDAGINACRYFPYGCPPPSSVTLRWLCVRSLYWRFVFIIFLLKSLVSLTINIRVRWVWVRAAGECDAVEGFAAKYDILDYIALARRKGFSCKYIYLHKISSFQFINTYAVFCALPI